MRSRSNSAPHLTALDDFNGLCCLLVVLIHVLSLGVTQADHSSVQGAAIYVTWLLALSAVPAFLFVGGMKMGLSLTAPTVPPYGPYVLRRVKKVYLPYVCWTAVDYLCFLPIGYVTGSVGEFAQYLWFASLSAQFYYVVVVMQFYLLRPLWGWMLKHIPWQAGLALSLVVMRLAAILQPQLAQRWSWFAPYQGRIFITYLLYWTAGLYAGALYHKLLRLLERKWLRAAAVVPVVIYAALGCVQYVTGRTAPGLELWKIASNLCFIGLLLCLCRFLAEKEGWLRRALAFLHRASLFVFFSHCLVLTIVTECLQKVGITRLSWLLILRGAAAWLLPLAAFGLWELAVNFLKRNRGRTGKI